MAYTVARDYTWGLKIASYDAGKDRRLRPYMGGVEVIR